MKYKNNPINKRLLERLRVPSIFAKVVLDKKLYKWQAKAVDLLVGTTGPHGKLKQIAVCAPNEGGKSSRIVATAAIWWLATKRRGKVAITTKDLRQLKEQIMPAIEEASRKFEAWTLLKSPYYQLTTPTGGRLIAYVTDEAGRVEGMHGATNSIGRREEPLLWICDEAKNIKDEIFMGIERCNFQCFLMVSSPGLKQGVFYKAFTQNRAQFYCVQAGLTDCPHITQDRITRIISKYGKDHPFTRSTLYGEFMNQDENTQFVVDLDDLERCRNNPPAWKPGVRIAFCDFAGGGADNVVLLRDGNKYTVEGAWKDADKMRSVGRFIMIFRRLGLQESQIIGDAADSEMLNLLRDSGWTISRQNFGDPPTDELYSSWAAEAWIEGAKAIQKCEVILPDDERLFAHLTSRKKVFTGRGKVGVEDKYIMRKRGAESPDFADCFFGALKVPDYSKIYSRRTLLRGSYQDDWNLTPASKILDQIGANAGWN
jgi:hypothetical protein